ECLFRPGTRPPVSALVEFIDSHKDRFGVEPASAVLEIASSTYYAAKKREEDPPARDARDEELKKEIMRVWKEKGRGVYGARKVWRELGREDIEVARCTVERLMRELGIAGAASLTLPMSRRQAASCIPRSSSTCSHGKSSDGRFRITCGRSLPLTRWKWRSGRAAARSARSARSDARATLMTMRPRRR